jgi:hypothetical protein
LSGLDSLKRNKLMKSAANVKLSSKIMSQDLATTIWDAFAKTAYVFVVASKKFGSTTEMVSL